MSEEKKVSTPEEFLRGVATLEESITCDTEKCGGCYKLKIGSEVAREMIEKGEFDEGAIGRWADEEQRRWRESKFFKLWHEESAAGRKPEDAFKERGWEA